MSFEITTNFVQQYRNNLVLLAQKMQSLLQPAVIVEPAVGETCWYDQIGTARAQPMTTRHANTPIADIPHRRRRIDMVPYNVAELIDGVDNVRMLAEPSGSYAQALQAAMNRTKDDLIIAAAFADAKTGKDGSTTVSFPAANQVAVNSWKYGSGSGNAGLTVSKCIEAAGLLNAAYVEKQDRYLAVTSKQLNDMLATTEATSSDFAAVKALVQGDLDTFMGFKFIQVEELPVDGSGYRRCIAWQKRGLYLGVAQDITAMVSRRDDKNYALQAYYEMTLGASRVEEARVVEIKCLET